LLARLPAAECETRNLMRGHHVASPTRYGRPCGGSPDRKIEETTMSRTFTALAATLAFTAVVATGSIAQAQTGMGTQMQQQGSGGMSGSMPMQHQGSSGMSGSMPMQHQGSGGMSGSADMSGSAPPMHARQHRGMRQERRAARRQMRADRQAANNPDGAYMGGGGVFERLPDGSLRPVR
jgi:hypothetical protein